MKDNYNTTIEGVKVKLVPYRPEHVPTYHAWMQNEALLEATASERLKLDEEYAMQRTWAEDAGKCTFIILDRERHEERPGLGGHGGAMAGDVNLFWNDHDDPQAAEIEVMVAETASRRKGIAQEALHLLMAYASTRLSVSSFTAKVGFDNAASQALFGKLGFTEVNRVEVFREIVFRLDVAGSVKLQLQQRADAMRLGEYD